MALVDSFRSDNYIFQPIWGNNFLDSELSNFFFFFFQRVLHEYSASNPVCSFVLKLVSENISQMLMTPSFIVTDPAWRDFCFYQHKGKQWEWATWDERKCDHPFWIFARLKQESNHSFNVCLFMGDYSEFCWKHACVIQQVLDTSSFLPSYDPLHLRFFLFLQALVKIGCFLSTKETNSVCFISILDILCIVISS